MLNPESRLAIGIDLGGTKIAFGLVDEMGRILHHDRIDTNVASGPQAIENQIIEMARSLQKKAEYPILGIGIGVAGQIDSETGSVIFAPNLKWHNVPIRADLEKALEVPVRVNNDVRALTIGEWLYGAGKGHQDILCVFIGTGIGGGVVSGGKLLVGSSNTLGEVGHTTIDFNGPLCTCGKKGCLECFAGGWGIAVRAREAIERNERGAESQKILSMVDFKLEQVSATTIIQAYHENDPMAKDLLEQVIKALIAGCASLVNAFNPQRLILGGGLIDGFPEIITFIEEGIRRDSLKAATKNLEVVRAKLGKERVLGSAAVIFDLLKGSD